MTGAQVRRIRKRLGLSQTGFARLLRVTSITISRWERDEVRVTESMALLMELAAEKAKKKENI